MLKRNYTNVSFLSRTVRSLCEANVGLMGKKWVIKLSLLKEIR